MALTEYIKKQARHLGFQLVGVTTPNPPPHLDIYESWLAEHHHGEMGYLAAERARQRRGDPRLILPECRSILVLGIRYSPSPPAPFTWGEGSIASYAWGEDYHNVLPPRLKALVTSIEQQIGTAVPNRWYTDTGPILERELAQRSGLGWIGKNTCLINPKQGSYFLLAEILLGVELEPDPSFHVDHCGSCTRCIDACPTGCILPNRTMDARRCISYLTIELKGAIPIDLRSQLGTWVFGCDICQQVCPWNQRFALPSDDPAFRPPVTRDNWPEPELTTELELTPQAFNQKFKDSPVKRSKRRGYLRNVAVALGNLGDASAFSALKQALYDKELLVRIHAAWALGNLGGNRSLQALDQAAQTETDPQVQAELRAAQIFIKDRLE
jgi:epoxyqueuosine reductase